MPQRAAAIAISIAATTFVGHPLASDNIIKHAVWLVWTFLNVIYSSPRVIL